MRYNIYKFLLIVGTNVMKAFYIHPYNIHYSFSTASHSRYYQVFKIVGIYLLKYFLNVLLKSVRSVVPRLLSMLILVICILFLSFSFFFWEHCVQGFTNFVDLKKTFFSFFAFYIFSIVRFLFIWVRFFYHFLLSIYSWFTFLFLDSSGGNYSHWVKTFFIFCISV